MVAQENSRKLAQTWPSKRCKEFEESLRDTARQWFENNKHVTHPRMPYCLAKHEDWAKNIICSEVAEYVRQEQLSRQNDHSAFPLHKYVHHGLSSQAMLFNLLGPLIVRKDLSPLRQLCESSGIIWPTGEVCFELEGSDRTIFNEDHGQPTSFDATITGATNSLFIEAKLVEKEFGGCSVFANGDCTGENPYPDTLKNCYLHGNPPEKK